MPAHTIGEIFRGGLLLSRYGTPYRTKRQVLYIVNALAYEARTTPWGTAKCLSDEQIAGYNRDQIEIGKRKHLIK